MNRITLPSESIRRRIETLNGVAPGQARWTPAKGGLSTASVWRLDGGEKPLAVRCWGPEIDDRRVGLIARTLCALQPGLVCIAAPRDGVFRDGATGLWEWAPWRRGTPLADCAEDPAAIEAAMTGLAAFHERATDISCNGLPSVSTEDRLTRLELIERETPPIDRRARETWPELSALQRLYPEAAERAATAIRSVDWSQASDQIIHGDARPEHFLIENGELTGLIDFGAMRRDTPWADLARLAGELAPGRAESRERAVSCYEAACGQPVDRAAVAAFDLAGAVLSAANWARWLSDSRRVWPDPRRVRERLRSVAKRLSAG